MLSPGKDVLGLTRIAALLERLGNPHLNLPPVFHVSGTNGKGSTLSLIHISEPTRQAENSYAVFCLK